MPSDREAAIGLVHKLRAKSVLLEVSGERLRVSAPSGVIDAATGAAIRRLKPAILAYLATEQAAETGTPQGQSPFDGGNGVDAAPEIPIISRSTPMRLGVVQERMWAHASLEPDTRVYNLPLLWRIQGPFDEGAFRDAFHDVVERHEVLRLGIVDIDGAPHLTATTPTSPIYDRVDVSQLGDGDNAYRAMLRDVHELKNHQIDFDQGTIFSAKLYRLDVHDHAFFLMPHHVIWDGSSTNIFLRDLTNSYESRLRGPAPLGTDAKHLEPTVQFADYAAWHRTEMERGRWSDDVTYWSDLLRDPPAPPNLPDDRPRPQLYKHDGAWLPFELDAMSADVDTMARRHRATRFMVFLTLWRAYLTRMTGDQDIIVEIPVQARAHPAIDDMIGCFVNVAFLRQPIDPASTFDEAVLRMRGACLDAFAHQEAPVEAVVEKINLPRDPSRTPLAQTMFNYLHAMDRPQKFGEADLTEVDFDPGWAVTDITLAIREAPDGVTGFIQYCTQLYSHVQAESILRSFKAFAAAALAAPDQPMTTHPLVDDAMRKNLVGTMNATHQAPNVARVHEMFHRHAEHHPDQIAITHAGGVVRYGDLAQRAARIGAWLAAQNVGPGSIIGVMTHRTPDMVAAILAIWRCGAAYLPLDPSYPEDRLRYVIADSGAALVLSSTQVVALADGFDDISGQNGPVQRVDLETIETAVDEFRREAPPAPDMATDTDTHDDTERAYVIYTSGSTGRPKGVENSHRALTNFLTAMARRPGFDQSDRLLAVTTLSFDISILELFLPLTRGGAIILATADEGVDPYALTDLIAQHTPTIMQATPATWGLLIDSGWTGASTLTALCGGEAMPASLAGELLKRVGALWNMYGPTETTVWSACKQITDPEDITVGTPIDNTAFYVVDGTGALRPPGMPGELWIGGAGVAIGYLNQPALTNDRFIPNPFEKPSEKNSERSRVYRTGDLARRLPNGDVEILGRMDSQVKLRGFRIELGEIETALEQHDAVAKAVLDLRHDHANEPMLAAYIVYHDGVIATGSSLRRFLRQCLPLYMIPQQFIAIDETPLTVNGKLDRKALPDPLGPKPEHTVRTPPATALERAFADIWREVLATDDIASNDNFFDLGGQSLQAARMVALIRQKTGRRIAPRAIIFETLAQLAAGSEPLSA